MNEKLYEMALQAGGSHFPTVGGKNLEKFAHLLIQSCADYIRENMDSEQAEPLAFCMERDFGLHGDYAE